MFELVLRYTMKTTDSVPEFELLIKNELLSIDKLLINKHEKLCHNINFRKK